MGHAKYIGRVGGLAVALGVGVAVATTPGVAWAGPSDSGSSNPTSDSSSSSSGSDAGSPPSGSPSTAGSSDSPGSSGDADAGASGDGTDSAAGGGEDETGGTGKKSTTATVKDKKSGSDASAAAVTPKRPKRAVARIPSNSDTSNGEQVAASTAVVQRKSDPLTACGE
jgi:hypothetical protein